MTHKEALAWLRGERSMTNIIPQDPRETWLVRIAQADAAMSQEAYWTARAFKDGIVGAERTTPPVEYIELNLSNYDDADVAQLNEWAIWAAGRIAELEGNK